VSGEFGETLSATVERFVEGRVLRRRRTLGASIEKAGLHERGRQPRALLMEAVLNRMLACDSQ
jgi:hypothetical protein